MNITLHKRARTTPAISQEIQQSKLSERKLAAKRFCPTGGQKPTGSHLFDQECAGRGIEHLLIKPKKNRRQTTWQN
jgi:hypothetical protein